MDENTQAKFDAKLKELLAVAKKKKNVLEYQEINDFFKDISFRYILTGSSIPTPSGTVRSIFSISISSSSTKSRSSSGKS